MAEVDDEVERLRILAPAYDAAGDFDRFMLCAFGDTVGEHIHDARVLDLGCSTGVLSERLAMRARHLEVIDGSQHYIDLARDRLSLYKNVIYHCSLFEEFEPEGLFDHIVCSHVLEHVSDPRAILERLKLWLAPQGSLWIYVPNAFSLHRRIGVAMGLTKTIYDFSARDVRVGHRRVYDPASLSMEITGAGLRHGKLGGMMIKPFTNEMMEALDPALIEGLVRVGADLPEIASDIYFQCSL